MSASSRYGKRIWFRPAYIGLALAGMFGISVIVCRTLFLTFFMLTEPGEAGERDPSYKIYQRYRYAYETYGYLFFASEKEGVSTDGKPGAGAEDDQAGYQDAGTRMGEAGSTANGILSEKIEEFSRLQDYDFLMKTYYSVHPSTTAPRSLMKADQFLGTDLTIVQETSAPQILIYHTHSQETYADYGPAHPEATVVSVGNRLTGLLEEKGWNVIHDTTAYDMKGGSLDRSRAYTYALEGITEILEEHPTIQVILDIHRDGVAEGTRLVTQVNGKPTARIMLFQGMSRTPEGEISYLPNPNLSGNLAFSFQMQLLACREYPDLMRKIYMKGLRYNLHLRARSSLIEVGAQTNTLEEAVNAMEPLAEVLDRVLQGK
ncbi:MAG: stage II sporulation protein P [Clostridiales bacterium]|nr:stage II sporulation protein P [Clostridiales bacterium]